VRCLKANAISVVVSDVEYVSSTQYFEVVIEAIHPEAEMCIGLAFPSVKDSLRLLPEEKHNHFGYCNNGDLVAFGKVYQTGAPLIRIPDRIGVMIDFSSETVRFFYALPAPSDLHLVPVDWTDREPSVSAILNPPPSRSPFSATAFQSAVTPPTMSVANSGR
jgi:hypothetical protein